MKNKATTIVATPTTRQQITKFNTVTKRSELDRTLFRKSAEANREEFRKSVQARVETSYKGKRILDE